MTKRKNLKFIDLFAGLGGFHLGLSKLGHRCVFACEINEDLQDLYLKNFNIKPAGDIRTIDVESIPSHDILCAGFPCQPFSKAGMQKGFDCPKWGDLFDHVIRIVKTHRPSYLLLENVPNLIYHDNRKTIKRIKNTLNKLGYHFDFKILSPHFFGIPQLRERVFIVGSRLGLESFSWPIAGKKYRKSIKSVLVRNPPSYRKIPNHVVKCLRAWQKFLKLHPKKNELPGFPIWSMEFGATYPYKKTTPFALGASKLRRYCGNHGRELSGIPIGKRFDFLPSYARTERKKFPDWKIRFIEQNRDFYKKNKEWIDKWKKEILNFPQSRQKFEWHCKGEERNLWKYIIQLRASGVRVKRPTTAPAIIAMTSTQIPIVAWARRYMTPKECSRLQSFDELKYLPSGLSRSYEALGNAVNTELVKMVAGSLLREKNKTKKKIFKKRIQFKNVKVA